jgi:hypothetical protein
MQESRDYTMGYLSSQIRKNIFETTFYVWSEWAYK